MVDEDASVLVIEDDPAVRGVLAQLLEGAGYAPILCPDGISGLDAALGRQPDLVILDLGLPGVSGTEILEKLRAVSSVPVLVVSARAGEMDKVQHLLAGADDYLPKPFGRLELLARVDAVMRRSAGATESPAEITDGDLRVDLLSREVFIAGVNVPLSKTEFALLVCLLRNPGQAVPNRQLLREAWNDVSGVGADRIKFTVGRLRRKLGDHGERILTVRGYGLRWLGARH